MSDLLIFDLPNGIDIVGDPTKFNFNPMVQELCRKQMPRVVRPGGVAEVDHEKYGVMLRVSVDISGEHAVVTPIAKKGMLENMLPYTLQNTTGMPCVGTDARIYHFVCWGDAPNTTLIN